MDIDFIASPNFRVGRAGFKPEAFVLHVTEGKSAGAIEWCLDPKSRVSYHFIVKECGEVVQLVDVENTAWHAGKMQNATPYGELYAPNPNLKTIGIAFAGFAATGPNFRQITAICELLRELAVIHKIEIDRKHLVFHNDIRTDKVCPGPHVSLDAILYMCSLT